MGDGKLNTLWDKATYKGGTVAAEGAAVLPEDSQNLLCSTFLHTAKTLQAQKPP